MTAERFGSRWGMMLAMLGMAVGTVRKQDNFFELRRFGYVSDLVVAAGFRRRRVGRQLYERIAKEIQQQEKRLIADFAPDVRAAMIELIGRLARAAEERVDTSGGTCCTVE